MRILIVNFEYPPLGGGGGVACQRLAEELARRHQVVVVTTRHRTTKSHEVQNGVEIWRVPVLGRRSLPTASLLSLLCFVPAALWRLLRITRQSSFDVLNAQFVLPSGIPAALISRWRAIPLVVSFIGGDVYDPTKRLSPHRHAWLRWLVRWVAHSSVCGTAISEDTKRRVLEYYEVTLPIEVTALGISPLSSAVLSRQELNLPATSLVGISIGRLIPRKGFELLLRVWRAIPQAGLVIVGDGPGRHHLQRLIDEYGLTDRVRLTGFVSEERKAALLRASGLYVSAAEHEGFGLVFLEAMDAGLPIVTFDNGGHRDFLVHEVNALLVAAGNEEQLGQAIRRLLSDEVLRRRLGTTNKNTVPTYYWRSIAKRFEAVLTAASQDR